MDLVSGLFIWGLLVLAGNAILSVPVAYVAAQKGRSAVGFFLLSFFLSFIVGILVAIAIPRREVPLGTSASSQFVRTSSGSKVKCPFCAEWINADAKICKHCGRDVAEEISQLREIEIRQQVEDQNRQKEIQSKRIEEQEAQSSRRKAKTWKFLKSKSGKTVIATSASLLVIAIAVVSVRFVSSEIERNEALAQTEKEQSDVNQDCLIVSQRGNEFIAFAQRSVLAEGLQYGDHAAIAASSSTRDLIQTQVNSELPNLISADELLVEDITTLGFPRAADLGKAVLYNRLVEGTNFQPIDVSNLNNFYGVEFSSFEDCDSAVSSVVYDAYEYAADWGEAVLVLRSCRLTGKLWDVPCL